MAMPPTNRQILAVPEPSSRAPLVHPVIRADTVGYGVRRHVRILAQELFGAQFVILTAAEFWLIYTDNPLVVYELSARLPFVALLTKGPGKLK
jgi:hypothetical protein